MNDIFLFIGVVALCLVGIGSVFAGIAYFLVILRSFACRINERAVANKVAAELNRVGIKIYRDAWWFSESEKVRVFAEVLGKSLSNQPFRDNYTIYDVSELRESWRNSLTKQKKSCRLTLWQNIIPQ